MKIIFLTGTPGEQANVENSKHPEIASKVDVPEPHLLQCSHTANQLLLLCKDVEHMA